MTTKRSAQIQSHLSIKNLTPQENSDRAWEIQALLEEIAATGDTLTLLKIAQAAQSLAMKNL